MTYRRDGRGIGVNCDEENTEYDPIQGCRFKSGYYFSGPYGKCVSGTGTGSGQDDPNPKITACIGKNKGDPCSYTWSWGAETGYFSCSDTYFT